MLTFKAVAKDEENIANPARLRWETSRSCLSVALGLMSVIPISIRNLEVQSEGRY